MSSQDPFGLWEAPPAVSAGGLSFSAGAGETPTGENAPASIWSVDLADAQSELDLRERQLQTIEDGLDVAEARLNAFLESRGETGRQISFAAGGSPEGSLLMALAEVDPDQFQPGGQVSYGLRDLVDWASMGKRFLAFKEMVEQQLLHYVWVQTQNGENVIALTTINWGSDLNGYLTASGLKPDQEKEHDRSVRLAIRSRSGNIRTLIRVSQMAIRIIGALTNPISALDALSLAWQFVQDIILPMLKQAEASKT